MLRTKTMTIIPVVLLIFVHSATANGICPSGCFCLAGYVTCSGLKSIPTVFPNDTRSVSITKINANEIPAGIFDKLPALESIEIYSGTIGKISARAFNSLTLLDDISLNELDIGTIEPFAFSNITNIGTISLYMSTVGTIEQFAFSDIFALDEIKLFMLQVNKIEAFALSNIDEIFHLSFYTNNVELMQPYAFSNFSNMHKFSMYLNEFGNLGCGSVGALLEQTYKHSFYSNSVNCSCDLIWVPRDHSLKIYLFSNWCQVPDTEEKIFWDDVSLETLQCGSDTNYECPSANMYEISFAKPGSSSTSSAWWSSSVSSYEPSSSTAGSSFSTLDPISSSSKLLTEILRTTLQSSSETISKAHMETWEPQKSTSSKAHRETWEPQTSTSSKAHKEIWEPQTSTSSKAHRETSEPQKSMASKPARKIVLPSTPTSKEIVSTSSNPTMTTRKAKESTKIDFVSDSTSPASYHPNDKVVISDIAETIIAVEQTSTPTGNIGKPQNVSFEHKQNDVNGSAEKQLCLCLAFVAFTIAVMF